MRGGGWDAAGDGVRQGARPEPVLVGNSDEAASAALPSLVGDSRAVAVGVSVPLPRLVGG